jgi:hypothetical protein
VGPVEVAADQLLEIEGGEGDEDRDDRRQVESRGPVAQLIERPQALCEAVDREDAEQRSGGTGDESRRVEVAQREPHQRHQQLGVVGDVHDRGGDQRPERKGVPPVQRIGLADQRLVVVDVVGDREAGEDREQAEPEHCQWGAVAEQEDDDRREDDEADVHDFGEGKHRRL